MPEKIDNNDVFSSDFLEPQKKSFREIIELVKLFESELKDVLEVQREILKTSDKKSVESLEKRKKAVTKVNQVSKEMLKLEKQRKTLSSQLAISESQQAKEVQRLRVEKQLKTKASKQEILIEKGLIGEYKKQSIELEKLRTKYKNLAASERGSSKEAKKLLSDITRLDKKLKKIDGAAGQFGRQVGNYPKVFGKAAGALRSFGLAIGGLAIMRNIFGIVKDFEQAQADLASVLGVNVDEMAELTDQARELGAATRFTAGEVSGLQKEFAKLGFDQTEIKQMTESTLALAGATGTELARAAEVTGSTLRGFGLDASETQRVVDVMAKSFSSSSLDMEKFATAMSSVAPVAKTAGLDIEKTTALLGTLTDRGIDASTAGTGLRNVFLELSNKGITFEEAMQKINSATDKNAAALDLFGKRGATIGVILSETAGDVANLEAKLNDAGGAAQEMADKQLNTLNGQLDLLKSAWEGFILDLEEGTGAFAGLKDVIGFVAANLTTIIKVITVAASAMLSYKAVMLASSVATKAYSAATIGFTIVQALLTGGLKKATAAMRLFNIVVKLNPIGLLITVIGAAVTAIALFSDTTSNAEKAQKAFNDAIQKGKDDTKELTQALKDQIIEEERLIDLQLKRGEITSEEADKLRIKSIKDQKKELRELIRTEVDRQDNIEQAFRREKARLNEAKSGILGFGSGGGVLEQGILDLNIQLNEALGNREGAIRELEEQYDNLVKKEQEIAAEEIAIEIDKNEKIEEERKRAREKRAKELQLLRDRLEDLDDEAIVDDEQRQIETLKTKSRREIEAIKGNSEVEIQLRNELKLKELREIAAIEDDFRKQREADAFKTVQVIGQQEQEQLAEQIKLKEIAAQKELDIQLELAEKKPEDVDVDKLEDLLNQRYDLIKRALEDERDLLLMNEELTDEERELINIQFNNRLAENERKRVDNIDNANNQIIDAQIDTSNKLHDIEEKKREDEAAAEKKYLQERLDALKGFAEKAIEIADAKTDKQIENIDKELEASRNREQQLQELAAKGNLAADQSVTAEIRRQAELERQKEELEKKKARRQIILEGLDLLSAKIDAGEKDAVTSTLNDMTRLLSALAFLPGFINGTETTVGAALGSPNIQTNDQDKYAIRVNGKEKILNPYLSGRTGNATTTEIVDGYLRDQSNLPDASALIRPQIAALHAPFQDQTQILKRLEDVSRAIQDKPILSDLKFNDLEKVFTITREQAGNLYKTHYNLKD